MSEQGTGGVAGAKALLERAVRSGLARTRRRLADLSPQEALRAKRDLELALAALPALDQVRSRMPAIEQAHEVDHKDYCTRIGHPVHAASLELVGLTLGLCETQKPSRVVDLGSGFTSFALRRYALGVPGLEVHSVDDNAEWLEKTRAYLNEKSLSDTNLAHWPDFAAAGRAGQFDLVLHDMGFMDTRFRELEPVLDLAKPGGLVILDDMHKTEYREKALATVARRGHECWSLKALTRDSLTRYVYLVRI